MAEEGTLTFPLEGKESETRYRLLFQGDGEALVAVYPVTGRMHQIRQHLKLAGHPVMGDGRYGGPPIPGAEGIALHSFRTRLIHPATGLSLEIFAPLPGQILTHIARLTGDAFIPLLRALPDLS